MARDLSLMLAESHVLVIDPDRLAEPNLALSRLFDAAAARRGAEVLGRFKAELAAVELNRQGAPASHGCRWMAYPVEIADVSWQRLRSLDLLVCCADNALARVEATLAARCLGLPLLDGAVMGENDDGGRVTCFAPHSEAACYLCGLGEERRAALLGLAAAASLPCTAPPQEAAMGSGARVAACLQQTAERLVAAIRTLLGRDVGGAGQGATAVSWALRLRSGAEGAWRWERVALRRSLSCPWHAGMRLPLRSVAAEQSFGDALAGVRLPFAPRLQFPWPLSLLAVCRSCGYHDQQPRRVALVRRRGVCAQCGTCDQLEPLRTVASVGQNDAMAKWTPHQLGWADRQLLQLRPSLVPAGSVMEER